MLFLNEQYASNVFPKIRLSCNSRPVLIYNTCFIGFIYLTLVLLATFELELHLMVSVGIRSAGIMITHLI